MMTKEEYEQWKHHPLTQQFHQFLKDYRQSLMEQWATGQFSMSETGRNTEMVARAQCLHDLAEMDAEAISQFYSKGVVEDGDHN